MDMLNRVIAKKLYGGGNSGGGGGGGEEDWSWVVGDGKTRLHITIPPDGFMDVLLCFKQSVANSVAFDWGDGSPVETAGGTGGQRKTHTYAQPGSYVITIDAPSNSGFGLGFNSSSYCVMGEANDKNAYRRNMLRKAELGNALTKIDDYAFQRCCALVSVAIPTSVTTAGARCFEYCYSLMNVAIAEGLTNISTYQFSHCYALGNIKIPASVMTIRHSAFYNSPARTYYDFSKHTAVPTLENSTSFNVHDNCEIRVPAALVDEWKAATNWSSLAIYIVGL